MPIYIIEHLEPKLWKWCVIEYKHISSIVGKENLWITNVKKGKNRLSKYGKVIEKSVKKLKLSNYCVLDPASKKTLAPKDNFDYYIFGGILGDYPPQARTKELLTKFMPGEERNIGKEQMSTDNAVFVVKMINDGTPIEKIEFKDEFEIKMGENESIELPYRYVVKAGRQLISKELLEYIKRKKGF